MPNASLVPASLKCASPLLVNAREAARILAICERSLWSMTAPRGQIPCIRLGAGTGAVRYSVDALKKFIESQQQSQS